MGERLPRPHLTKKNNFFCKKDKAHPIPDGTPPKNSQFGGDKIFLNPEKFFAARNWMCHVLFAKEMKKIRQIWPQQLLKHFTAGYRGFPPCTQSQYPINRETGYSNVLGVSIPPKNDDVIYEQPLIAQRQ